MRRSWRWILLLAILVGVVTPAVAADRGSADPSPSLEYRPPRPVIPEPKAPHPLPPMTVFAEAIGRFGISTGSFDRPVDVVRDASDNFYVLDAGNSRLQVFDHFSNSVLSTGSSGFRDTRKGEFNNPEAIAINNEGLIYIADTGNNRIQVFKWAGQNDCAECPATRDGRVLVHSKSWGSRGSKEGDFNSPKDIAIDKDGNIYVLDSGNDRVQQFTAEGVFKQKWSGSFGVTGGIFTALKSIALSDERVGSFYTLGTGCMVQQFSLGGATAGTLMNTWPAVAPESGLCVPARIEVDNKNHYVYVLDAGNSLLMCFNPDGLYRWALSGAQVPFSKPLGFAVNPDGDGVLVADTGNNIVQKFTLR